MVPRILDIILKRLYPVLCACAVFGVAETVLVRGFLFYEPHAVNAVFTVMYGATLVLYIVWVTARFIGGGWRFRPILPDIVLFLSVIGMLFPVEVIGSIVSFRMGLSMTGAVLKRTGLSGAFERGLRNPARLLLASFLFIIAIGIPLLMLPAATADGRGASFVDAVFTSTSATCVTGLVVRDTGSYFSGFGHMVILILMQVGGLGIMTFSTLFAIILGRRLGFREEEHMRGILDQSSTVEMYDLIIRIVSITMVFETFGALLLFLRWAGAMGSEGALKSAVFHAVSAFCNAGFSLNADSLSAYVGDWYVNVVFIVLIVVGGIGFVVLNDVLNRTDGLNPFTVKWSRLTVHSRLAIITSAVLIVAGMLTMFFFEFDNSMLDLSVPEKLLASLFQSVTCRTAGFNTVDTADLRDVTLFICMILMFIGASPASTGGGIKTTTFTVLLLSVRCLLRSRDEVELFGRTIPHQTVYKAVAIVLFSLTFLVVFTVLLLATETGRFADILFEAVSAIGTVGLSTGVTGGLTAVGKLLITTLMYVGRVGPLTVALALGEVRKVNIEYPTTRITVG